MQATSHAPAEPKSNSDIVIAVAMVAVLGVMILPLHPVLLDILLASSLTLSLVIFLFAIHIEKPLDFSSFPSLLLMGTLIRLALNVASTRLILLHGNEGENAAGYVIQTFGQVVIGGNVFVGIIIFAILVIINFVVITKGSGRIAEVAARFTLDSMPGKQMAIDADLAAGLINEEIAKTRRKQVEQEADFFGSMDGAGKFVRGDAIAGLIITVVNVVGGLIVGVVQHNMPFSNAVQTYTTLTIGDGLVSQIPALLTSIAAGLVATRAATAGSLGGAVSKQIFGAQEPLVGAGAVLLGLSIVPGMPHFAFLLLGGVLCYVGWLKRKVEKKDIDLAVLPTTPEEERAQIETMLPVDLLEIEVGYELIPLVDASKDGSLMTRIAGIRKQIAQELGIIIPPVHMRDNLRLKPGEYRILISGNVLGKGELSVGKLLAINPGGAPKVFPGEFITEPAFGLKAIWISSTDRERAEVNGYTVVDASTAATTHLSELVLSHAADLIGRKEAQELLDLHSRDNAKVIEELIPGVMPISTVIKVLKSLLKERISVRDFRTILETLADYGADVKDPEVLTEYVRQRLGRQIVAKLKNADGFLPALVLSPVLESIFRQMQGSQQGAIVDAGDLNQVVKAFEDAVKMMRNSPDLPAIVVAGDIRRAVSAFVVKNMPGVHVLSFKELDTRVPMKTIGVVGQKINENYNQGQQANAG